MTVGIYIQRCDHFFLNSSAGENNKKLEENIMKNSKRLVTLLLALVMLVGMFTVAASATEPASLTLTFDASNAPGTGVGSYTTTVKEGGSYKLPGTDAVVWSGAGQLFPAGTTFTYAELQALASSEGVVGFVAFPNSNAGGNQGGNQGTVTPPATGKLYDLDVRVYVTTYGYVNNNYYTSSHICNGKTCYGGNYCSYKAPSYDWDDVFDPSWNPYEGPYAPNYKCNCNQRNCQYCGYYYYNQNDCYGKYYPTTNNKYQNDYYYGTSYGSTYGFRAYGAGSYNAGEQVTLRAKAPSGTNYRFVGWYNVNKKFSNSMTANFTMPAADTTVYAVFQVIGYGNGYYTNCNQYHSHTIRYTDGVSNQIVFNDVVKTVKHGATTPTIADPVRPGYRFVGWTPKVSRTATECVTYVAQWSTAQAPRLTTEHVAYLKGFGKGEFRPDNKMTRAEYAVLLYRLLDAATVKAYYSTTNNFTDVKSDAWYNEAVSTLAAAGVIGYGSTFRPTEDITRAEMISMLANFYTRNVNYTCTYRDVPSNYWAYDEIAMAQYNGWIKGYGASTFLPEATITRAEVAAVMNRVLGRDNCKTVDTKNYKDNPTTAWFYQDVVEATIAH